MKFVDDDDDDDDNLRALWFTSVRTINVQQHSNDDAL